jgi:hypothetical protein
LYTIVCLFFYSPSLHQCACSESSFYTSSNIFSRTDSNLRKKDALGVNWYNFRSAPKRSAATADRCGGVHPLLGSVITATSFKFHAGCFCEFSLWRRQQRRLVVLIHTHSHSIFRYIIGSRQVMIKSAWPQYKRRPREATRTTASPRAQRVSALFQPAGRNARSSFVRPPKRSRSRARAQSMQNPNLQPADLVS